jgi:probable rRNA maturation factor
VSPTSSEPATDAGSTWLLCQIEGSPRVEGSDPTTTSEADEATRDEVARFTGLVAGVLEDHRGGGPIVVGLQFVDADQMAELNLAHLGHEGPTDVLSFPIDGDPRSSTDPVASSQSAELGVDDQPPWMLGDIVICPAVAAANAPSHAGTYDDELALLIVHGLLHLLGLDHAADDERVAMQARERDLLGRLHGPLAGDPWEGTA